MDIAEKAGSTPQMIASLKGDGSRVGGSIPPQATKNSCKKANSSGLAFLHLRLCRRVGAMSIYVDPMPSFTV